MKHILLSVLLLASPLFASDDVSYYKAGEFSLYSGGYVRTSDFESERSGVFVGAEVFFTKNIGAGVSTAFEDINGTAIDNVSVYGKYRVVAGKSAPYVLAGATRLLQDDEWGINLAAGIEHRFTKSFGVFTDAGMLKFINRGAEAVGRVGLKFSF